MIRSLIFRTVAALTALTAAAAGPVTALAHSYQHVRGGSAFAHHAVSTEEHDAHAHAEPCACAAHDEPVSTEAHANAPAPEDHPHIRLESGRTLGASTQLSPSVVTEAVESARTDAGVPLPPARWTVVAVIVAAATGPPPPSRAPPIS